ncbi:MAG TPA: carboxypeptidase-like regulatory domain-containing protein [Pirellulales bacterium]|nr:carboxypeptidase-like regulatory domain-containing protein [Pirellulales bacterium]
MTRLQTLRSHALWVTLFAATSGIAEITVGSEESPVLRGHVLLPDGKPAAGADIYWLQLNSRQPQTRDDVRFEKRAVTDEEGRFELSLSEHDAPLGEFPRQLIAHKSGYGIVWRGIVRDEIPADIALRLTDDLPIRGHVTDTEGRPVAGAKVRVTQIQAPAKSGLDNFLAAWKRNSNDALAGLDQTLMLLRPLGSALAGETDKNGQFEVLGVGVERLATVTIVAPGLVTEEFKVVQREGFEADQFNRAAAAGVGPQMRMRGMLARLIGPVIEHVAEAEVVIRGTVFTGPDRKPVVMARVGSPSGGRQNLSATPVTDANGHFEARGVRRSPQVPLNVFPPFDSNLLTRSFQLDVAPGQTEINLDVELKEGIVVEGRLFDPATGDGVRGSVTYVPLPDNRFVDEPGYEGAKNMRGFQATDPDGHFRRLVAPGPGVLMAQVQSGGPRVADIKPSPYRQARFSDEEGKRVPTTVNGDERFFTLSGGQVIFLGLFSALKVLDLAPDSGPLACDLSLDSGKTATIAIEDEQGNPVSGAWVAGVADIPPITYKIEEPTCTIYGLGADRPRRVWILHTQRGLAGSATLTGEEAEPVTVRLGAPATISGRALDPDGEPLADAAVQVSYLRRSASELFRFAGMQQPPLKTDGDGRFRVENVLPGERLAIGFKQGDAFFRAPQITDEDRQLKAGEQLDLGDVKAELVQ